MKIGGDGGGDGGDDGEGEEDPRDVSGVWRLTERNVKHDT